MFGWPGALLAACTAQPVRVRTGVISGTPEIPCKDLLCIAIGFQVCCHGHECHACGVNTGDDVHNSRTPNNGGETQGNPWPITHASYVVNFWYQ
eukprot:1722137-Amphidinium_carterae.1